MQGGSQRILRDGDRGDDVADWQRSLNEAADARLAIDAVFGPQTVAATERFQRAHKLLADGEVGSNTRAAMASTLAAKRGSHAPPPLEPRPPFPGHLLRRGDRGRDVMTWQAQMSKRGSDLEVDGVFGPRTEQACRAFQAQQKIGVDGVIGQQTWAAAFVI
jgi:peptidoglycan hydrolase-like protein with peptidoglycan-binding domain